MTLFSCVTCNKVFDTQPKYLAHRTNSVPCRQKWEEYVLNFPSAPFRQAAVHTEDHVDVLMQDSGSVVESVAQNSIINHDGEVCGQEGGLEDVEPNTGSHVHTQRCGSPIEDDQDSNDETSDDPRDDEMDIIDNELLGTCADDGGSPAAGGSATQRVLAEPAEQASSLYTENHPRQAGYVYGNQVPRFTADSERRSTEGSGNVFYPFANEIDFELGAWLHESGLSMAKIDEFLKLQYVRFICYEFAC